MQHTKTDKYNNNLHINSHLEPHIEYIDIAKCVFDHICATPNLSTIEKIYYLLLDCEAITNRKSINRRVTANTAKVWATKLVCTKSQIFHLQKKLEQKGYLIVQRSTNVYNQNNRNVLSTSLPKDVFAQLASNRKTDRHADKKKLKNNRQIQQNQNNYDISNYDPIDYRAYLDQTKIFLIINFTAFSKIAASKKIPYIAKLFCIDYYSQCHSNNQYRFSNQSKFNDQDRLNNQGYYNSTFTYDSLMERYNISRSYLSKNLTTLNKMHLIHKHRIGKYINPPIWNASWHLNNIKDAA